jgi:hypothetical protein
VGGLPSSGDDPYFLPGHVGVARGTVVMPGSYEDFQVTDSGLLSGIALRNGDIITIQSFLSQADYQTPTNDPPANPLSIEPFACKDSGSVTAGATQVALNTVITLTLTRAPDPTTVSTSTVELSPAVSQATVYVNPANPNQIIINPNGSNFTMATQYTITIPNTLPNVTDQQGNAFANEYTLQFSTFTPGTPTVSTVTPGTNAAGVAIGTTVTVVMSVPVQAAQVTSANVQLIKQSDSSVVTQAGGSPSLAADNMTITVTPSVALLYSNAYYVKVTNLENLVSVAMAAFDGSVNNVGLFTTTATGAAPTPTVSSCSPGSNATGVAINTTVVITMNTAINPTYATTAYIGLYDEATSSLISINTPQLSGGNTVITITPKSNLTNDTAYYIVIENQVASGNPFSTQSPNPYYGDSRNGNVGRFTTVSLPAPTVSSVTPGSKSTGVAINTTIAIVMSTTIQVANVTSANVNEFFGSTTVS